MGPAVPSGPLHRIASALLCAYTSTFLVSFGARDDEVYRASQCRTTATTTTRAKARVKACKRTPPTKSHGTAKFASTPTLGSAANQVFRLCRRSYFFATYNFLFQEKALRSDYPICRGLPAKSIWFLRRSSWPSISATIPTKSSKAL